MKKTSMLSILILFVLLAGCKNSASYSETNVLTNSREDDPGKQAEFLTEHLIASLYIDTDGTKSAENITPLEINNFILKTVNQKNNTEYMYSKLIIENPELHYNFPVDAVKRTVYEVFGIDDWVLKAGDVTLNEQTQQYETGLEFGFGTNSSCINLTSQIPKDTGFIQTLFSFTTFTNVNGDPAEISVDNCMMTFRIINENGQTFLRFVSMEKISS